MAGEFTKVPQEAKSVNDMMIWAAKNGQAETAQDFIHSLQNSDMAGATDALNKLGDYAKTAENLEKVSGHLSTIENMGKVLEIADKVKDGDYLGASVQAGAEVLDATASKFLQEQGPHGIALDYLAHKAGDEMAEKLHEYQGFKDQEVMSQADLNAATVAAWQHERATLESGVQERIDAGQSPEEAQQWARDHIQSHGAVYNDLGNIGGNFGDASQNRQITDQLWIVDRANEMAHERDEALAEQERVEQPDPVTPPESAKPVEPAKPVEQTQNDPGIPAADAPEAPSPEVSVPEAGTPDDVPVPEEVIPVPEVVPVAEEVVPVLEEVNVQQVGDHDVEIVVNHNTTNIYVVEATTYDNDTVNVDQSQDHSQTNVDQSVTQIDQSADHSQTSVDQSATHSQNPLYPAAHDSQNPLDPSAVDSIEIPLGDDVPWQTQEWNPDENPLNEDGAPLPTEVDLGLDDSPPIPTEIDIDTYDAPIPTEVNVDEVFVTTADQWDEPIAKIANEGPTLSDTTVAENDANVHNIAEGQPVVVDAERDSEEGYENSYTDENEDTYVS